tara:strand:+ start:730 stop:1374 length:645 start_codon:yes stop_codon:yes gene_type:complete
VPSSENLAELWARYAPKIAEARSRDAQDRHELFLQWYEESIGGLPAVQLTAERFLLLSSARALLGENSVQVDSLLRFLWIVSPSFSESKWRGRWFRWRHRKIDLEVMMTEIEQYLKRQFRFAPPSKTIFGKEIEEEHKAEASQAEWISSLLDLLCSEYGWKMQEVLQMPISICFLLCGRIRARLTATPFKFTKEADKLQDEFMHEANAMKAAEG